MKQKGFWSLIVAALIATGTAIAHLSCIALGPSCYRAQMAPEELIQAAIDGSWLASASTIGVSSLFLACALFALSGAGVIRRLPLLKLALAVIAGLCLLRGIATIPLSFLYPEMVSTFSIVAGIVWFASGLMFAHGLLSLRPVSPS